MVRAMFLRRSGSDGRGVVGWEIYEKDAAGMGSSTTKLHAVVDWIVSEGVHWMCYSLT